MLLHLLNKPDGLCHLFLVECVDKNATEVSLDMWQFPCILASALSLGGSCHSWAMDGPATECAPFQPTQEHVPWSEGTG